MGVADAALRTLVTGGLPRVCVSGIWMAPLFRFSGGADGIAFNTTQRWRSGYAICQHYCWLILTFSLCLFVAPIRACVSRMGRMGIIWAFAGFLGQVKLSRAT